MKDKIAIKHSQAKRRAHRTRSRVSGTSERPRLSVFRSSKHISVQVIDDTKGKTIASSSDKDMKAEGKKPLEIAEMVGEDVAKKTKEAGIETVVFDRGPYKYHGRVKALADGARKGGLEF